MKYRLIILMAVGTIFILGVISLVDVVPPLAITRTAITEAFARIHLYAQLSNKIPESLDILPKREGYANCTTDGWKRNLQYSVDSDGIISLKSFGKDGLPGGSVDDADVEVRYHTRDTEGRSIIADPRQRELMIAD